jgi:hypothetical protein
MTAVGLTVFCILPMALGLFTRQRFRHWSSCCLCMEGREKLSYCFGPCKELVCSKKISFLVFIHRRL